eukprot:4975383-Prymnesium_polylepis.2
MKRHRPLRIVLFPKVQPVVAAVIVRDLERSVARRAACRAPSQPLAPPRRNTPVEISCALHLQRSRFHTASVPSPPRRREQLSAL